MHASKSFSKLFYMLKLISPSSPSKVNFYLQRQVPRGQKKYLQKKTFGVMYLIQTALVLLRLDLNPERRSCNVKFCNGSLEDVLLLECWSTLIKGPFTEIVFRLRGSLGLGGGYLQLSSVTSIRPAEKFQGFKTQNIFKYFGQYVIPCQFKG